MSDINIYLSHKLESSTFMSCPFCPTMKGFVVGILLAVVAVYPQPTNNLKIVRLAQQHSCKGGEEYLHDGICCLNCPAGKHLKATCTSEGEMGTCEECDFGTYTAYPNHLQQCLTCRKCHPDQMVVRQCTHDHDTDCQCKPGTFCLPDDACEVCTKCKECGRGAVTERNCTSTSNAVCKEIQPTSGSGNPAVIVPLVLLGLGLVLVIIALGVSKKKCRQTDSESNLDEGLKVGKVLRTPACTGNVPMCGSLSSSASNSQQSSPLLTHQQCQPTSTVSVEPTRREHEPFPTLVPVNGDESLRSCFKFFEKVDINQHRKFFRHLSLEDNVVKSTESLPYDDRMHALLASWMEKEGQSASLNDLLGVLLQLQQRRTAEDIKNAAVLGGFYTCGS